MADEQGARFDLQEATIRDLRARVARLESLVQRQQTWLDEAQVERDRLRAVERAVEEARAALVFYADHDRYEGGYGRDFRDPTEYIAQPAEIEEEGGERARAALAALAALAAVDAGGGAGEGEG